MNAQTDPMVSLDRRRCEDAAEFANEAGELNRAERFDAAARLCLLALSIDPSAYGAWCNLGNALAELQRHDDAIAAYANCLRLAPGHAPALANMGVVLMARGAPAQGVTFLEMAAELEPENAETRCNLGLALLAAGDLARGFAEYEWRWRTAAMAPHGFLEAGRWRGEAAPGSTLLVHEEGGFGDTIQFVRFARAARARVGRLILRVRAPLARLLENAEGVDAVVLDTDPLPAFDLHCPMLSLAHAIGAIETAGAAGAVMGAEGYLAADPRIVGAWRDRVLRDGPACLRVGLVWAGSPRHGMAGAERADRRRSISLDVLGPVLDAAPRSVRFTSLQVGEQPCPPGHPRVSDRTGMLRSFADTAALVSCLDLVIAVDTSTAHLAAAMGKPVWLLSRYDQCWRWMAGRTDSPWYRSVTIFRQDQPGDWSGPVARIASELAAQASTATVQFGARRVLPA